MAIKFPTNFKPTDMTSLDELGMMAEAGIAACERIKVKDGAKLTAAENYAVMALICAEAFWPEDVFLKELQEPLTQRLIARGLLTIGDRAPHPRRG